MSGTDGHRRAAPAVDLSNCEQEPIHVPGSIQPHGFLLVLAASEPVVLQASENLAEAMRRPMTQVLDHPLNEILGDEVAAALMGELHRAPFRQPPVPLTTLTLPAIIGGDDGFQAVAHRTEGGIVLELEAAPGRNAPTDFSRALEALADRAERAATVAELCQAAAEEVRRLTGFDRVLVYRFDEDWNGTVIGEDRNDRLPSYLHHRFPASDIPAQARELYRHNRLRLIPDASYRPVRISPLINPSTGQPLDLTYSVLRSVSPVHLEYMRNMETASSMSVSILRDGRLWGLISCHHRDPKTLPFTVRTVCDLLARLFVLRLATLEHARDYERRLGARKAYAKLLAAMADRVDFATGLIEHPEDLLTFTESQGAAVLTPERCSLVGNTPSEHQVRQIAEWLFHEVRRDVYCNDALPLVFPAAGAFEDRAGGLLAIAVSKLHPSYVLWFRPEVIQTIEWGGDPQKPIEGDGNAARLHPRRSFATWRETVRHKSLPWRPADLEAAAELRNAIIGIVLKRAETLAGLNAELERSNRELEAFSYSVSHDLRAPLRHVAGYAEILRESAAAKLTDREIRCIDTILESSAYAGALVDRLLAFSRLGRGALQRFRVDMNALVREIRSEVSAGLSGRDIAWTIGDLPTVEGDVSMLRLAVQNLVDNAVKYTRHRDRAVIEVGCREEGDTYAFFVRDNGVGFDMRYVDKLFGVFQRLHRMEDFEGTGIGLANVRRVVERHGGRTWAEGEEGRGATFYFTLPRPPD